MVKRLVSLGAAVCILFSFLCIPAAAVDSLSGTVRAEFYVSDNFTSWSTRTFDLNYPTSSQYTTITMVIGIMVLSITSSLILARFLLILLFLCRIILLANIRLRLLTQLPAFLVFI